jgi:hypothetical protein
MAYTTLTKASSVTAEQAASIDSYISSEITAGNTDGVVTSVTRTGVDTALIERSWKDSASATAYISFFGSIGAPVTYAAVVNPL